MSWVQPLRCTQPGDQPRSSEPHRIPQAQGQVTSLNRYNTELARALVFQDPPKTLGYINTSDLRLL